LRSSWNYCNPSFVKMMTELRSQLTELKELLRIGGEHHLVEQIGDALEGSDATLSGYLVSNELWGGAGSIADQALTGREDLRGQLEDLMIRIGRTQMGMQMKNVRTEMWVDAFENWKKSR
ncbi:MAG: hypothetical protein KF797_12805, partial [Flavobacteriales bacterium]|nr:hypothetical protein [Flavobacteriales bacterium]